MPIGLGKGLASLVDVLDVGGSFYVKTAKCYVLQTLTNLDKCR